MHILFYFMVTLHRVLTRNVKEFYIAYVTFVVFTNPTTPHIMSKSIHSLRLPAPPKNSTYIHTIHVKYITLLLAQSGKKCFFSVCMVTLLRVLTRNVKEIEFATYAKEIEFLNFRAFRESFLLNGYYIFITITLIVIRLLYIL